MDGKDDAARTPTPAEDRIKRSAQPTLAGDWNADQSASPWRSQDEDADASETDLRYVKGLSPGDTVGRYEIRHLLGVGGTGRVYCAFDPELDREVALKVLSVQATGTTRQRLVREARAMASLSHPNIVQVHHVGEFHGTVYIAMEILRGGTLTEWIFQAPREYNDVLDKFIAAGSGLAHAHAAGMVHRDFKPDNVLLGGDGVPRVVDFGLARREDGAEPERSASIPVDTLEPISGHSSMLGTPAYMAPEQFAGGDVDSRADQFGFAASVYEGLYGRRPFSGRTLPQLAMAVTTGEPEPPPTDRNVPPRIWRALRRALARAPDDRYADMNALLSALSLARRSSKGRWTAGIGVVAVAGLAATLTQVQDKTPPPCEVGSARVDAVWAAQRRAAITSAFAATDLVYAEDARKGVTDRVETWSTAWREAYGDACRAAGETTATSRTADLQMRCLTRQLGTVDALLAVLTTADAGVVRRAAELAAQIPDVARCEDPDPRRWEVAASDTPAMLDAVAALDRQAADVRALQTAGRVDDALAMARTLHADATPDIPAGVRARGLLLLGKALERDGDYDGALKQLTEAEHLARGAEVLWIEVDAAVELTYLTGYRLAQPDEARRWAGSARAAIERSGGNPDAEARLLNNEATLHERQGDYQAAFDTYERARQIHEAFHGASNPAVARYLTNMGLLLNRLGRPGDAEPPLVRAVELITSARGAEHPSLVPALNNLGVSLEHQGDLDGAAARYAEALRVGELNLGKAHPNIVSALNNLANIAFQREDFKTGEALVRRGLAIREEALGRDNPRTAFSVRMLGSFLSKQGDIEAALPLYRRALAAFEVALGPDHPECASTLEDMGRTLTRHGRPTEALAHLQRSLKLRRDRLGDSHPAVAVTQLRIGQSHAAAGDLQEATRWFDRAKPVLVRELPEGNSDLQAVLKGPQPPPA